MLGVLPRPMLNMIHGSVSYTTFVDANFPVTVATPDTRLHATLKRGCGLHSPVTSSVSYFTVVHESGHSSPSFVVGCPATCSQSFFAISILPPLQKTEFTTRFEGPPGKNTISNALAILPPPLQLGTQDVLASFFKPPQARCTSQRTPCPTATS